MLTKERIAELKEVVRMHIPEYAPMHGLGYTCPGKKVKEDLFALLEAEERRLSETEARLKEENKPTDADAIEAAHPLSLEYEADARYVWPKRWEAIRRPVMAPKEEKPKVTMTDLLVALKSKGIGKIVYVSGGEGYWKIPHSNIPRLGELFGVEVVEEKGGKPEEE
jgi:hypothetical protein